ncbi:hypothetical protein C2S52_010433 [Perilla frutescens var. hirtella]|nr:hypothetical protein C2S52_010433 [Perilla frutescens var. hirtella]
MDSLKNDPFEEEEEEHRRKTLRRLIIIGVSSIVLVLLMAGAIVGILIPIRTKNNSSGSEKQSSMMMIKSMCGVTLYQESCYSSIYALKLSNSSDSDDDHIHITPKQIFMLSLQVTLNELMSLKSSISQIRQNDDPFSGSITLNALDGCSRLIQDAVDHVNMSVAASLQRSIPQWGGDVRTWLSTALTDQQTCLDDLIEFANISSSLRVGISASMINATIFTSNSLAIVSKIPPAIIQVAKDGSGDYETITEAVNAMPKRSKHRFFIHVKKGEYNENVHVDTNSWNLMLYGDGMENTVVSSNLNYADGVGTYDSGTLSKFTIIYGLQTV